MTSVAGLPASILLVAGVALVLGCGLAVTGLILGVTFPSKRTRAIAPLERERDLAAALGWPWRAWATLRVASVALGVLIGAATGVWLLALLLGGGALVAVRFAVAGRAAKRRLRMERAFLIQLRVLRERMALAHQSLDTALIELASSPGPELGHILAPLRGGGSIAEGIVACGMRSRSPVIEGCCAVLLWARTRSIDALIDAIDGILLPVGEAQLAVEEESMVTLTQQRAVTFAMAALMAVMLASLLRVDSFRAYYETAQGTVVLIAALAIFSVLTTLVGRIVRVARWTRWDLRAMLNQEAAPRG